MSKVSETTLEINLGALKGNFDFLKSKLQSDTLFLAVVKAFAYGSDSIVVGKYLEKIGVDYFAVAYVKEGVKLRQSGVKTPILVLHPQSDNLKLAIQYSLEPSLYSLKLLKELEKVVFDSGIANYPVHMKFNTGLNRLGFKLSDVDLLLNTLAESSLLKVRSVFSHLAASEDINEKKFTENQIALFRSVSEKFINRLNYPVIRHLCNTSGVLNYPEAHFDMVRCGIGLYGYGNFNKKAYELKPVASLKSIVSQVFNTASGETVGYNRGHVCKFDSKIATIPLGHADGIGRQYGNGVGAVYINHKKANIINVLDKTLKQGGHFIVTFMDNKCLDDLFGDKKSVSYEIDNEIVYLLERESLEIQSNFGNALKITLNGNNILGEGSDEWIIDFDDFCKRMESRGYRCIETELFSKLYNPKMAGVELQECERNISFLNRYCVFEKVQPKNIDIHIRNQIVFDNMTTEFDFDTIDLHQKNIIVQRISSLYNIVDLVNCIEYRYYKNDIKNAELDNIPENIIPVIETMFNDLRIQYKPIFIKDPLDFSEYSESNNQIYFTYHKHTVEKRSETDTNEENVEYNNWYIIMYKDQLLFKKPIEQTPNEIQEIPNETTVLLPIEEKRASNILKQQLEQSASNIRQQLLEEYNTVKDSNAKLTIKILKSSIN